jgi:enoyl-[acyl-carrier protein] reductase I
LALLTGTHALVVGVANKRSIAWGIARALAREGADLVLTYQNERLKENVVKLAPELPRPPLLLPLDVTVDDDLERLREELTKSVPALDVVVHSVAHARREDLEGRFLDTSRSGYLFAHDVSAYSLIALTRAVRPLLRAGGSVITLTYHLGAARVTPNYNVMGAAKASLESAMRYLAAELGPDEIRVNAISSGPIKTLAASGVKGFSSMLGVYGERTPLRRALTAEDVGDVAVFLASPLSRAITGSILFTDNGYHMMAI